MTAEQGRYALVVTNSLYSDPILKQLRAPTEDAKAFAAVLRDPEIGGFEVRESVDQPSWVVAKEVERFFSQRRLNDVALFYFSGHGIKDEDGKLYFAAMDTEMNTLRSTAVSSAYMTEVMSVSKSKKQVLLLDCCYAGAFSRAMQAKGGERIDVQERFKTEGAGRVVITASDAMQYALEGDQVDGEAPLSVFTQVLVEGIRTGDADLDRDGRVSLDELYAYVYERVRRTNPNQTPTTSALGKRGEMVIAVAPGPEPPPARPEISVLLEQVSDGSTEAELEWQLTVQNTGGRELSGVLARTAGGRALREPTKLGVGEHRIVRWREAVEPGARQRVTVTATDPSGARLSERVEVAPAHFMLHLDHDPAQAKPGTAVTWQVTIENTGACPLNRVVARTRDGHELEELAELGVGEHHVVPWQAVAAPGARQRVTVTATDPSGSGLSKEVEETVQLSWSRLLVEGSLIAGVVGALAAAIAVSIFGSGLPDLSRVLLRVAIWVPVGLAIALWLAPHLDERAVRSLVPALAGVALAAVISGAIYVVADGLPELVRVVPALAAIGAGLGALVGALWIPSSVRVGLVAGAAAGAVVGLIAPIGDLPRMLAVGIRSAVIVGVALATLVVVSAQAAAHRWTDPVSKGGQPSGGLRRPP